MMRIHLIKIELKSMQNGLSILTAHESYKLTLNQIENCTI